MAENANNRVKVTGVIVSEPIFSHITCGKIFYSFSLAVGRLSGREDILPAMICEDLIERERGYKGKTVQIEGQYRSFNSNEGSAKRLLLYIFVTEIGFPAGNILYESINQIYLDGYVCRKPVFRKTPSGLAITDLHLAVNRLYNKSDYIPCVAWNANAKRASTLSVSSRVCVSGRIQSRDYMKRLDDNKMIKKTAYEVSVFSLECKDQDVDISTPSC